MTNVAMTHLKFANIQMAAALLLDSSNPQRVLNRLKFGKNRASKLTSALAEQFVKDWNVEAHQPGTYAGFSGMLFECRVEDSSRGLALGERILSLRSSEFTGSTPAVDDDEANILKVMEFGWDFGQIVDMENWVDSLGLDYGDPLIVTGYGLDGHLATAFNILHPCLAHATYIFNDIGSARATKHIDLSATVTTFKRMQETTRRHCTRVLNAASFADRNGAIEAANDSSGKNGD